MWHQHRIEDVATPQAYAKDPQLVQEFYNQRRKNILATEILPNHAHLALAELEKNYPGTMTIITQNIDDLHERAGSKNVIHMHGELLKIRCDRCDQIQFNQDPIKHPKTCAQCKKGNMRPHIVWFGEMPLRMPEIQSILSTSDLFVSIGTSAQVYPAALFVELARHAHKVEINLESTVRSQQFHRQIRGKASIEVPLFVQELLRVKTE